MENLIDVQVCYALPQRQEIVQLKLPSGATVLQAISASGLLQKFPDIDLDQFKVGVFGKLAKLDALLQEHDRVEIYRPLIADPKEMRRKRSEEGKVMKKGGGESNPPAA